MVEFLKFFSDYAVIIYFFLLIALVFAVRRFFISRQEKNEAIFGLELELAQRRHNQAVSGIVVIGLFALAELVLVFFLAPTLPAFSILLTPTGNPGALPTNTVPAALVATLGVGTPQASPTIESTGCIPGQIMITSPKSGEQVRGRITITGTADIPNFGFYKYEFSPVGSEIWTTVQAGREIRRNSDLGEWDTTELSGGDYHFRLVVSDNDGKAYPACVVSIRILPP